MPGYWNRSDTKERATGEARAERRQNERQERQNQGGRADREWANEFSDVTVPQDVKDAYDPFQNVVERERDYGGMTYTPGERKIDPSGMAYYETALLPSGLSDDPETWKYGEFGYGPGEQYGHKWGMEGPSWSQLTQWGIQTGQPWADPNWLVGGAPGQGGGYGPYRGSNLPETDYSYFKEPGWGQSQIQQQFIDQQMGFANRNRGGIVSLLGDY